MRRLKIVAIRHYYHLLHFFSLLDYADLLSWKHCILSNGRKAYKGLTWEAACRETVLGLFPRVRSLTFLRCLQPFKVMLSPFSPLSPGGPWGPTRPIAPFIPFGPRNPFAPLSPWSPLSPCGPFSPGGPWSPGGPGIMVWLTIYDRRRPRVNEWIFFSLICTWTGYLINVGCD